MGLKLNFASLSLGAAVDQQTGSLSVFEVLEEVRTPQIPVVLQSLVISIALEKDQPVAHQGKVFIHIVTPDQKSQIVGNGDMILPAEQKRMKAVFRLSGFPIQQFGMHRFVVSWTNNQNVKEGEAILDFEVMKAAASPQQAGELTAAGPNGLPN